MERNSAAISGDGDAAMAEDMPIAAGAELNSSGYGVRCLMPRRPPDAMAQLKALQTWMCVKLVMDRSRTA